MKIVREQLYEKFTEESDPVRDMGIGQIESSMNILYLKKRPTEELEELYKRVHKQNKANVIIDGEKFDGLPQYSKTRFNNLVVKALNYKINIGKRDAVRNQGFKPGDAIKCEFKGKWYIGYIQFSKRGIIKTDNHGRIAAKTLTGVMKIPLDLALPVTLTEQKKFDKEFFLKRKRELERQMNVYREWLPDKYKDFKKEYDELMKTKKVKNEG